MANRAVYGIDMGTSNFKIYDIGSGTVLNEKNIIAIKNKDEIYGFGDYAFDMYEKAPEEILVSFPIKNGVIADLNNMERLFNSFYDKVNKGKNVTGADFIISVPTDITEVSKRAFFDVIDESKAKAHKIMMVEKPVADSLGVSIDPNNPKGNMIVNIGADTTEISVMSMGGIVISRLIPCGGNVFDDSIVSAIRHKHNLVIGMRSAEKLKISLANALNENASAEKLVFGRNIVSGLPVSAKISGKLVYDALYENVSKIVDSIKSILERTPPELSADIIDTGIYVTGGSGRIKDFDKLINKETGLKTIVAQNPEETVIHGLNRLARDEKLKDFLYVPNEKKID